MRTRNNVARHRRRRRILKAARGFFGARKNLLRIAKDGVMRARTYAYTGRKLRKRDFRSLWIIRIGAAARLHGLSYNKLIHGLKLAEIDLNRKMLSEMAIRDAKGFEQVAGLAKAALEAQGSGSDTPAAAL